MDLRAPVRVMFQACVELMGGDVCGFIEGEEVGVLGEGACQGEAVGATDADEVIPRGVGAALVKAHLRPADVTGHGLGLFRPMGGEKVADEVVVEVTLCGLPPGPARIRRIWC
ncbi:hypothetical protein [Streptomyces sp. NBC_01549]|uniref:hypothetical protein n=1 Tax=Streptomyces sp. NBC_01549 TaxID=2975874 RepID=UPI002250C6EC|nr:hypothetical protein [Streptomyces sp. NBC_01549]